MASHIQIQDGPGSPHEVDWSIIWNAPTEGLDEKQTPGSPRSYQGYSESCVSSLGTRPHSLGSTEITLFDNDKSHANLVVGSIKGSTTTPFRTNDYYQNLPEQSPKYEETTRGLSGVMMPNSRLPLIPRAPIHAPNPTATPPLSDHVSAQEDTHTGETILDSLTARVNSDNMTAQSDVGLGAREENFAVPTNVLWQRIQKLRLDNWSLRSQIHELRVQLRDKRTATAFSVDNLFQRIRKQQLLSQDPDSGYDSGHAKSDLKSIAQLIEKWQAARNDYGPLEDDCNLLEDRLNGEEFQLARMEDEYYRRLDPTKYLPTPGIPRYEEPSVQSNSQMAGLSLEEFSDLEYHPQVANFLSKLGDLDLLREHYDELIEEQESLAEEKLSLAKVQRSLGSKAQDILDSWDSVKDDILIKLNALEDEVGRLRQDCLSKGLINEEDDPTDFEIQEQASFSEDTDVVSQDHISEYVKYPSLLPRQGVKENVLPPTEFEPDEKPDKSPGSVNQWLLNRLRSSALDVRLLASITEEWIEIMSIPWEELVLNAWFKDGTSKQPERRVYTSSMSTHGPFRSENSTIYHF
ncbi:hypothetical protein BGZ60DRAFT_514574 [Tricladium varicosporioides]|nr:hypothetical protein BGZ60DRAFT_514574 [Hymenoscyphus varicosporioides]